MTINTMNPEKEMKARELYESIVNTLNEVLQERYKQEIKWGEQNHPNGTYPGCISNMIDDGESSAPYDARNLCERKAKDGFITYAHILWEEFCEAMDEVDDNKLRKELIQVAAVAVAWVECIDKKNTM